ncbi:MAG: hypothetical protein F4138_01065 [Acidimicrobiia bacterium]|nr:hypothetical protein [Acidimicrobiia bacterium]
MRRWIALFVACLFVLSACGNSDDTSEESTPTATAEVVPTPVSTPAPTPTPQELDPPATEPPALDDEITNDALTDEFDEETTDADVPEPIDLSAPAFTSNDKLSTAGLGAMYFGTTPEQAAAAIPTLWTSSPEAETPRCFLLAPANGPNGIIATVYNGRIERLDINNSEISTRSGARLGSTEAELFELFGGERLVIAAHASRAGNTITFVPVDESDKDYRVIFETDGTTVISMRAGRLPAVQPTDPCG